MKGDAEKNISSLYSFYHQVSMCGGIAKVLSECLLERIYDKMARSNKKIKDTNLDQ